MSFLKWKNSWNPNPYHLGIKIAPGSHFEACTRNSSRHTCWHFWVGSSGCRKVPTNLLQLCTLPWGNWAGSMLTQLHAEFTPVYLLHGLKIILAVLFQPLCHPSWLVSRDCDGLSHTYCSITIHLATINPNDLPAYFFFSVSLSLSLSAALADLCPPFGRPFFLSKHQHDICLNISWPFLTTVPKGKSPPFPEASKSIQSDGPLWELSQPFGRNIWLSTVQGDRSPKKTESTTI